MLTPRQNFIETVTAGGNPDRFVNQYEALRLCIHPMFLHNPFPMPGQENVLNAWGITFSFPEGQPAPYPVHTNDKVVIKNIENWQDYVHAPYMDYPEEEWEMMQNLYNSVDTDLAFKTALYAPGLFEMSHHLGEITNTFMNMITNPDEMHDLYKYLKDFELSRAEMICERLHPEVILHHDDWGSHESPFFDVEMFEDFFLEPYREIYSYYKSHGVKYIVHHSDSYCKPYVPTMIEMGIDVWQGCLSTNDLPELVKQYRGKITFMGGFDGADYDHPELTSEDIRKMVFNYLDRFDSPESFIPCIAQGGPGSLIPGVYETIFESIDLYNEQRFGINLNEIRRIPMQKEEKGFM